MKQFVYLFLLASLFWACSEPPVEYADIEKDLQTQFIIVEDGGTIDIDEGHFKFSGSLTMDAKKNIVIRGAGKDKTFLSFHEQEEGAEGIKITNSENIIIQDLTIQDTKGDCIKVQKTKGLTFRNVRTQWTGEPKEENGSYGFYPVDCDNVLLDQCISIGASDAGIYVGQSRDVVVKNCEAYHNVAGIEIENCIRADVYDNLAHHNTGGILVFDMPNLTQSGNGVRVFNNMVKKNNFRNFAPEGNIVGEVPPGTGVMVMATDNVEVFDNQIIKNKTAGAVITSYLMVKKEHHDEDFDPYPKGISIFDNTFKTGWFQIPELSYDLGKMLFFRFWFWTPDIVYDGIMDPNVVGPDGKYPDENRICIRNNGDAKFVNADAGNDFENLSTDLSGYDCTREKIDPVVLNL